jgi:hypothetical protein
MNAAALLEALYSVGAAITVEGEDLVVEAPRGALSPDLRAALADAKPGLLKALRNPGHDTGDNIDRKGQNADHLRKNLCELHPLIREACLKGLHHYLARVDAEIVRSIIGAADSDQDPGHFHSLCRQAGEAVMLAALVDEYRYQLGLLAILEPEYAFKHAAELELCLVHEQSSSSTRCVL